MTRLSCVLLVFLSMLALSGCGGSDEEGDSREGETTQSADAASQTGTGDEIPTVPTKVGSRLDLSGSGTVMATVSKVEPVDEYYIEAEADAPEMTYYPTCDSQLLRVDFDIENGSGAELSRTSFESPIVLIDGDGIRHEARLVGIETSIDAGETDSIEYLFGVDPDVQAADTSLSIAAADSTEKTETRGFSDASSTSMQECP
jgi:hypothetical protein